VANSTTDGIDTIQMLTTFGEKVVLQMATAVVQSTDGLMKATAQVLLDSASQRTFMMDQLARQLQLKVEHKDIAVSLNIWSKASYI